MPCVRVLALIVFPALLLIIIIPCLVDAFHVPGAAGTSSLVEERRLLRCRASHSRNRGSPRRQGFCLAVAGSAGTVGSADLRKAQDALQEAVNTRKVDRDDVSDALETLSKVEGVTSLGADDVEGTWELVFSTQLKSGYMPVRELIQFYPSRTEILIDTNVGPLPLGGVRGECSWEGGAANKLTFSISAMQFGPVKIPRAPKTKTYQFFFSQGKILAARSSAESLSLLLRVSK